MLAAQFGALGKRVIKERVSEILIKCSLRLSNTNNIYIRNQTNTKENSCSISTKKVVVSVLLLGDLALV